MSLFIDTLSFVLLAGGGFFALTGAVGMLRMADFYTRLHPAGVNDALGMPMILCGLMLQEGFNLFTLKLFLLMLFMLLTSPTACHALAKAALLSGLEPIGKPRRHVQSGVEGEGNQCLRAEQE